MLICERALRENLVYAGRSGHLLLPGVTHILRIRVVADMETRIKAVMQRLRLGREKAKEYIEAGDIFQVVLAQQFQMPLQVDPFTIYRYLRSINPSPYLFFVRMEEGAVLVGTTDLDHPRDLAIEPNITEAEVTYLMKGIQAIFPSLNITLADCLCAFAGIRPVLSEGKLKPSEESREHVVWVDQGLVTVTGGKLTTFRRLALDALIAAKSFLPPGKMVDRKAPVFNEVQQLPALEYGLSPETWRRLYGRYGSAADTIVKTAKAGDLTTIAGTHTLWAELPYVAQNEQIRHLGDLLLRRVRIGLLTPQGGKAYLKRIQKLCKKVLPWDRRRWKEEVDIYLAQWNHAHALPARRAKVPAQRKIISFQSPVFYAFHAFADRPVRARN